jgi:hypothetical protein
VTALASLPPRPWRARAEVKRIDLTFNSYS